mgnify:FL=1
MKELYRFRQFLTEGVIKENIMVSPIIMFGGKKYIEDVISSPDDFGFDKDDAEWVKNNILSSPKMVSIQDYMDLDDKWVKQAQIDTSGGGALDHVVDGLKIHVKQELITPEQEKEAMKVVGLSEGVIKEEQISPDPLYDMGYSAGEKAVMALSTELFNQPYFDQYADGFIKGFQDNVRASQDYAANSVAEGEIKENEEQGYTLYDTNVEYDNGKTGYMFQLVNSEDGEENEIGFDQLYFDDEDNRLEVGVDFNSFDQGSYQEGEYTADEAMELYRKIK